MDFAEQGAHAAEVQAWREARLRRLTAPAGWLSLTDRMPLDEGDNQLPIGTAVLREGEVRFQARPGVDVTYGGQAISDQVWLSDEQGGPQAFHVAGRTYELIQRGLTFAVRVRDPDSPFRKDFRGLDWYPIRLEWRLQATFVPYDPPRAVSYLYDSGPGGRRLAPGYVVFEVAGREHRLESTIEEESQRLFFVFGDKTNEDETYQAGRFLYAALPRANQVVLDFNQAYNPPCAFTPYAICPLAPSDNKLTFRVEAGEKRYRGSAHHP